MGLAELALHGAGDEAVSDDGAGVDAAVCGRPRSGLGLDDGDRTARRVQDRMAHRAQEHAGEAPVTA